AAPLNAVIGKKLYLPFDSTGFGIGVAFTNPNNETAEVSVDLADESGQSVTKIKTFRVPPRAHYSEVLTDVPDVSGRRGAAVFTSSVPLAGLGIRSNGGAYTSVDMLTGVPEGPKIISQIANGRDWKTTIMLVNTAAQDASFRLNFWKDSGTPFPLPLTDG